MTSHNNKKKRKGRNLPNSSHSHCRFTKPPKQFTLSIFEPGKGIMAGEGKDHDGGDAASSGLTINEMMEKYPRKKVEQAMFTRNYAE